MNFLPLLDERVVLSDTLEGQLVHQVDLVGVSHVLLHEGLHREREGGGVQEDLSGGGQVRDEAVQEALEVLAQQLVGLVQTEDLALLHVGHVLLHQIQDAAWSGHHQVHLRAVQPTQTSNHVPRVADTVILTLS